MLRLRLTSFVSECCKADRSQMSGYGQSRNPLIQGAPWALIVTEKDDRMPKALTWASRLSHFCLCWSSLGLLKVFGPSPTALAISGRLWLSH